MQTYPILWKLVYNHVLTKTKTDNNSKIHFRNFVFDIWKKVSNIELVQTMKNGYQYPNIYLETDVSRIYKRRRLEMIRTRSLRTKGRVFQGRKSRIATVKEIKYFFARATSTSTKRRVHITISPTVYIVDFGRSHKKCQRDQFKRYLRKITLHPTSERWRWSIRYTTSRKCYGIT